MASDEMGIRAGAKRIEVYNEGLFVYVVDEDVFVSLGGELDEEGYYNAVVKLAKAGKAIVYELRQDDEVIIEVAVGQPLSRQELGLAKWLKPQTSTLSLPTGKLLIHTANTLGLYEELDDRPGVVELAPGEYVARLHRIDWDELKNAYVEGGGDPADDEPLWLGGHEVLTLTPVAETSSIPKKVNGYFPFPVNPKTVYRGKYEIQGGVMKGLALSPYYWEDLFVNVDLAAQDALGLELGKILRLEVRDFVFEGVFVDSKFIFDPESAPWVRGLANGRPEFGAFYRPTHEDGPYLLHLLRTVSARPFPIHEKWLPTTITVLDERHRI